MTTVLNDLHIALRQYVRQPGFALTVVSTLALTIGATTAVFSVVNTVLVRALPFASPDRLVRIASVRSDSPNAPFSLPEFMDYRSQTRTLSGLAAYANWSASLAGDGITERLNGARMSANTFDVLGVSPAAGRLPGRRPVAADLEHGAFGRAQGIAGDLDQLRGSGCNGGDLDRSRSAGRMAAREASGANRTDAGAQSKLTKAVAYAATLPSS